MIEAADSASFASGVIDARLVGLICNQACMEAVNVAVLRTHTAAQSCRGFYSYVIGFGTIACHMRESSTYRGAFTVQLALSLRARSTQDWE